MSKRRRKIRTEKERLLADTKLPSPETVAMMLRGGAGKHTESLAKRNARTGRLKGSEKSKYRKGDHDD